MLNTGDTLDQKYRVIGLLGKGGMGNVYLAENMNVGNRWAVKEIDVGQKRRIDLLAEAEILKKLNHRSLPRIVDVIQYERYIYIIEDYFEGTNLKDLIRSRDICTEENVIKWSIQLCEILHYLHNIKPHPVIYRDMKPGNIIIDTENNAKLIDLGIAREYKAEQDSDTVYIGTRGYAAPEQYYGLNQTDERTDIYALGATMYHVLTGLNPNAPPYQMLPVSQVDKSLSVEIERIITKCIQNDPDLRYQNVQGLMDDLQMLQKPSRVTNTWLPRPKSGVSAKLVIIGSLSSRAGSSFLTGNLAAALAAKGISTAVAEFPVNIPHYYDALFLSKEAGGCYISWPHEIQKGNRIVKDEMFSRFGVTWMAVDPTLNPIVEWTGAHTMQLVFSLKEFPVIFLDVSTNWTHPGIRAVLPQADRIYLVVDPDPVLLDRTVNNNGTFEVSGADRLTQEFKTVHFLTELEDAQNCNISVIINKFTKYVDGRQISLPFNGKLYFPHMDPDEVYRALWEGELLYCRQDYKNLFDSSLSIIIKELESMEVSLLPKGQDSLVNRLKSVCRNMLGV